MKNAIRRVILALCGASGAAFSADTPPGGPSPEPKPKDAIIERYQEASARKDWRVAAQAMREGLAKSPANADYHNLYAYSLRKGESPDMSLVFKHYNEALRIAPKHRGAHEYLGEAYLMVGNLAKAKEHLGALDKLCFLPCAEYTELKHAIAKYEQKAAR